MDCILICWGLEFMGELLVVWRSCGGQVGGRKPELPAQVYARQGHPRRQSKEASHPALSPGPQDQY